MPAISIGALGADAPWMHSLETGVCSQLIASCLVPSVESEAYLAGLLHDLGVLEMYEAHAKPYSETISRYQREQVPLIGLEGETFGETHGKRMLARAGDRHFPQLLTEAIAYHDAPQEAPGAEQRLERRAPPPPRTIRSCATSVCSRTTWSASRHSRRSTLRRSSRSFARPPRAAGARAQYPQR